MTVPAQSTQTDLDLEVHRLVQWAQDHPGEMSQLAIILRLTSSFGASPDQNELPERMARFALAVETVAAKAEQEVRCG